MAPTRDGFSETLSEYEVQRLKNIEENEAMLKKLFPQGMGLKISPVKPEKPRSPSKPRRPRSSRVFYPSRSNPPRKAKRDSIVHRYEETDEVEDDDDLEKCGSAKLIVKVPFPKRRKATSSSEDEDDLYAPSPKKKVKRMNYGRPERREITEEDLVLVATRVAEKRYDSSNGTTCHQCRQKTDDLKTQCYGDQCVGVRGQFCGPCLKNRYGEDAKEALMSQSWVCPPCRGICNCSFCMKKRGQKCTGILIHFAHEQGYNSVKDLLAL